MSSQTAAAVPRSVSLVDPVTSSALQAISTIQLILESIHDVQRKMEEAEVDSVPCGGVAKGEYLQGDDGKGRKAKRREQIMGE